MWRRGLVAVLALAAGSAAGAGHPDQRHHAALAQAPIPQSEGWVLVVSRCVICHSVEVAVQQRQGPEGWGAIIDRMARYGMPLAAEERQALVTYLVRHFGDPDGR